MSTTPSVVVAGCALTILIGAGGVDAAEPAAVRPGDDAMTCEQIAMELSAYGQQITPNVQALLASQQQLYAQAQQRVPQRMVEDAMLLPLAQAGALDPTGASKRAYQAALMAQTAKRRAEDEALANSPLAKQNKAQGEQLAAQAQQMQSNARLQRLMQFAQEKRCDKR